MSGPRLENLAVNEIELDRGNPRIQLFLEMYAAPTPKQIYLALGSGGRDTGETFDRLRSSILSSGGVVQPIIVNRINGRLVCIEGNTRVAIYRSFIEDGITGNWTTIPAMVHDGLSEPSIDAVRLQVHLVGPRQWDAYSKAKYLHHLRTQQLQPFDRIIEFCGGNKRDIQESIAAYADMERHYRPLVDEGSFDVTRFSGFRELQKPKIKEALFSHGFGVDNFATWIKDQKIDPLNTVRDLPAVLRNERARQVFLKRGMREALKTLDRPDLDVQIKQASLAQLARALTENVRKLEYSEVKRLKDNPDDETAEALVDALAEIQGLVEDIRPPA
jgi:hypothetical protein